MTGVYLNGREIIHMFFIIQVSVLIKSFNIGIYSDAINGINVKLCLMVLVIGPYQSIPLSMTLTIFQGHSNGNFNWKSCVLIQYRIVKSIMDVPQFFHFCTCMYLCKGDNWCVCDLTQTLILAFWWTLFKGGLSNCMIITLLRV